jgi:hypothetical protein
MSFARNGVPLFAHWVQNGRNLVEMGETDACYYLQR